MYKLNDNNRLIEIAKTIWNTANRDNKEEFIIDVLDIMHKFADKDRCMSEPHIPDWTKDNNSCEDVDIPEWMKEPKPNDTYMQSSDLSKGIDIRTNPNRFGLPDIPIGQSNSNTTYTDNKSDNNKLKSSFRLFAKLRNKDIKGNYNK